MLPTIAAALFIIWAVFLVCSYSLGGLIHIALVLAVVAIVFEFIDVRRLIY